MGPSVQLSQPLGCLGLERVVWGLRTGESWGTFRGRLRWEEKRGSCSEVGGEVTSGGDSRGYSEAWLLAQPCLSLTG